MDQTPDLMPATVKTRRLLEGTAQNLLHDFQKSAIVIENPMDGEAIMRKLSFNKSLYSKAALLKAAYHFTDRFYVYLDADDTYYTVELTAKDRADDRFVQEEFSNEILAQSTREEILRQTSNIRELILGRAFGSTIIDTDPEEPADTPAAGQTDAIFKDWYKA